MDSSNIKLSPFVEIWKFYDEIRTFRDGIFNDGPNTTGLKLYHPYSWLKVPLKVLRLYHYYILFISFRIGVRSCHGRWICNPVFTRKLEYLRTDMPLLLYWTRCHVRVGDSPKELQSSGRCSTAWSLFPKLGSK